MKSTTAQKIQKLDDVAINKFGIPSLCLMETAGRLVSDEIIAYCRKYKKRKVTVVCGVGNNAGDGFVIARYLINAGLNVSVVHIGQSRKFKKDALLNYTLFTKLDGKVESDYAKAIGKADIIVDALFGVGLSRDIESPYWEVIECINKAKGYVFSVDVPSGINATTGKMCGIAVKAKTTITFTMAKTGLLKADGKKYTGRLKIVDIGIPKKLIKKILT